jgi:hypothetical protein
MRNRELTLQPRRTQPHRKMRTPEVPYYMNAAQDSGLQGKVNIKIVRAMFVACLALGSLVTASYGQTCQTATDMDPATRSALEAAGKRYFDMAAKGDVFSLKQNAIPSLASNFSGVETAVIDNKANLQGPPTIRPPFLLQAQGTAPMDRAEFLCGVFGAQGQTANSAVFVINSLPPGTYGIVITDVTGPKGPYTVSFVLQQIGTDWKVGGFYARSGQVAGHDAQWYIAQARQYKAKNQNHNAYFYYQQARELVAAVPFMSTLQTDKLYDEAHAAQPSDIPAGGNTVDLQAAGKTYKLTTLFPLAVGNDLDLVVKYQSADVSNTTQAFNDNMAVIKALVAKYPELREAFAGLVARAVQPDGKDYGSLLQMKDIK